MCQVLRSPSPARTAGRHPPKDLPHSVQKKTKVCRTHSVTEVVEIYKKETDLSKDELCCKVQNIIQLLRFIYDLSFYFQKALHHILQLLAVGTKKHKHRGPVTYPPTALHFECHHVGLVCPVFFGGGLRRSGPPALQTVLQTEG